MESLRGEDTDKVSSDVYSEQFATHAPSRKPRTQKAQKEETGKISKELAELLRNKIKAENKDYATVRGILDDYQVEMLEDITMDKYDEIYKKIDMIGLEDILQ